jgi:pilus assembly protein Flp/PilA
MERAMRRIAKKFFKSEAGATAIEYGLIAAIVGVGIVTAITTMRNDLRTTFGKVSTELKK